MLRRSWNLQELSRYESPEMRIKRTPIASRGFLDNIRERFLFLCEQVGITLECSGETVTFSMDELLMQRCVSNIVQNALQHTEEGGRIHVLLSTRYSDVHITIENTGHIPEADIEWMFDRMYRGNTARRAADSAWAFQSRKQSSTCIPAPSRPKTRASSPASSLCFPRPGYRSTTKPRGKMTREKTIPGLGLTAREFKTPFPVWDTQSCSRSPTPLPGDS